MDINKTFMSKQDSKIIQGIAISLMVWHHLFGFPERIGYKYTLIMDTSYLSLETILSYFGRICIAMFSFVSGYGLCVKTRINHDTVSWKELFIEVFKVIKKFYIRYWIVFVLFVPYGIFIRGDFELLEFIKNFIGLSSSYNAEWWYVKQYILLLLIYPFLIKFMYLLKGIFKNNQCYYMIILAAMLINHFNKGLLEKNYVALCFIMGVIICTENIYEKLYLKINNKSTTFLTIMSIGLVALIAIMRIIFTSSCLYDYLFVPGFIFGLILIFKNEIINRWLGRALELLGGYSMSIWLTHTFFIYYYFQRISFLPYYSVLIFLWVMLINSVVAYITNLIYRWIENEKSLFIRIRQNKPGR